MNPMLFIDCYKLFHRGSYPKGTQMVFSNLTPRGSRMPEVNKVVFFGLQYFLKEYLINQWNENFFNKPIEEAVGQYKRIVDNCIGKDAISYDHIEALHKLGYLPLEIKALPEGSLVDLRIPMMVFYNTVPEFFWLTNYIETILSATIWQPCTSATIAYEFRKVLDKYALETSSIPEFVDWQSHLFAYRGMSSNESAMTSGAAYILSFKGSDSLCAAEFVEKYYEANCEKELILGSVVAEEHSSVTSNVLYNYSKLNPTIPHEERMEIAELQYLKRLLTEVYPTGILSYVADSFSYWRCLTQILPALKDKIMTRNGKLVIRPDSSPTCPEDMICGRLSAEKDSPEYKGSIEVLWDLFGGTINSKGYKELDPHIGLIYGDSITLERAKDICSRLKTKGFASTNIVLGTGSYTFNMTSRDVFGFAIKATAIKVNDTLLNIYKSPQTDSGVKKSAHGLLAVYQKCDDVKLGFMLTEEATWHQVENCELKTVFKNGELANQQTLAQIRARLASFGD